MSDSNLIRLQSEHAQSFFDEALRPDLDELKRRDAFLAKLEATCPIHMEGTDIVAEIPNISRKET